jgi:hypothetical protein
MGVHPPPRELRDVGMQELRELRNMVMGHRQYLRPDGTINPLVSNHEPCLLPLLLYFGGRSGRYGVHLLTLQTHSGMSITQVFRRQILDKQTGLGVPRLQLRLQERQVLESRKLHRNHLRFQLMNRDLTCHSKL